MIEKTTVVCNPSGLHARPASDFVAAAGKYKGTKVKVGRADGGEMVNAKSIVMVLSLAVMQGQGIRIAAEGADEAAAVEELIALVDSGFGE